ncbi:MAG: Kdo hydroxylase family protein [Verrucomicrobia bacterium]|nr:Kdo hydroxylase family protein [Verrucomicrobiota bacterium]
MALITIEDFAYPGGWADPHRSEERSRWCCEQLEDGAMLLLKSIPFDLPASDLEFLRLQQQSGSPLHKNISYRPYQDKLRGFEATAREDVERLHQIMRTYSAGVTKFLSALLAPYAPHWKLDYASFRPLEEKGRDLPVHKRNDLLHVDAFPSRPTRGARILRCFTNVNPDQPREWVTGDHFPVVASRYAKPAGLARIAGSSGAKGLARRMAPLMRLIRVPAPERSKYDEFMLRFHDYLKENTEFQREGSKLRTDFPPLSTWIVFTDGVPHAVLSGRLALEQTFIIPLNALLTPQKSPIRTLETLAGVSLES